MTKKNLHASYSQKIIKRQVATVSRMRPSCICSTGDSWKVFTPSLEGEAEQYSKSNPLRKFTLDPLVQLKHHTKFDTVVQKSG